MSTELQTGDMLRGFDFDSFSNDNDTKYQPFNYIDALGRQYENGSQPDNDAEPRADQASLTQSRRDDMTFRPNVTAREGTSSAAKHNMPLLLHPTISEDYSNKERVNRKLYCAMDKAMLTVHSRKTWTWPS